MNFKYLLWLFLSVFVFNLAGASTCEEYGKKAVACYELGHLANHYDETGENCGTNGLEQKFIWTVEPSQNPTVRTKQLAYREFGYVGGKAWESTCSVSFLVIDGEGKETTCHFRMVVSLGTEDGDIAIQGIRCK